MFCRIKVNGVSVGRWYINKSFLNLSVNFYDLISLLSED